MRQNNEINSQISFDKQVLYFLIIGVLCTVNMLLPIERGFPGVKLLNYSLALPVVTSLLVSILLVYTSKGKFLKSLNSKHCVAQLIFAGILALGSFNSENSLRALQIALSYFSTFVLNYLVLVYLFEHGARQLFINTICVIAALAAVVGILEGYFQIRLPFYDAINTLYRAQKEYGAEDFSTVRIGGTLGNPIIYGTMLMFVIPFASELRIKVFRYLLVCLLVAAMLPAVSRTPMLLLGTLLIGGYITVGHVKGFSLVNFGMMTVLCAGFLMSGWGTAENIILAPWVERLSGTGNWGYSAAQNVEMRQSMAQAILSGTAGGESPVQFIFGHSVLSTNTLGRELSGAVDTVDNTYLSVFYELGLLGIIFYVYLWCSFIWRMRSKATVSLHFYSVVGLLLIGVSFVTISYMTFNFVIVASIAVLSTSQQKMVSNKVEKNRKVLLS